jgi:hypothetical protein
VCRAHLKDRAFCSPIVDEAEKAAREKKEALDREIELIKKEYEEKQKKKKAAKEKKGKDKDQKADDEEKDKKAAEDDEQAQRERDEKVGGLPRRAGPPLPTPRPPAKLAPLQIKAVSDRAEASGPNEPRIFSLHRSRSPTRWPRPRADWGPGTFTRCASTG